MWKLPSVGFSVSRSFEHAIFSIWSQYQFSQLQLFNLCTFTPDNAKSIFERKIVDGTI